MSSSRVTAVGRPKSSQTRQKILETATKLFLEDGYSNTSLEHIAVQAAVTKPTVYSHFKSKKGLFDAVIGESASHRLQELSELLEPTDNPREDLIQIGDLLLSRILEKEGRCWDRLAATEAINHPEIGEAFYRAGPAQVLKRLTKYFELQTKAGRLNVPHTTEIAELFIGMLVGLEILRTQIGQPPPSVAKRKRRCREAVDIFIAAFEVKKC